MSFLKFRDEIQTVGTQAQIYILGLGPCPRRHDGSRIDQ